MEIMGNRSNEATLIADIKKVKRDLFHQNLVIVLVHHNPNRTLNPIEKTIQILELYPFKNLKNH